MGETSKTNVLGAEASETRRPLSSRQRKFENLLVGVRPNEKEFEEISNEVDEVLGEPTPTDQLLTRYYKIIEKLRDNPSPEVKLFLQNFRNSIYANPKLLDSLITSLKENSKIQQALAEAGENDLEALIKLIKSVQKENAPHNTSF